MAWLSLHSPVGDLTIHEEDEYLIALEWGWAPECPENKPDLLQKAANQLHEYFDGDLKQFNLPLNLKGTSFQKKIWAALQDIPYGQTLTYGALAKKVNNSPRPIGSACGANPLPIIIPCHRILGTNGSLNGYSAGDGITTKKQLLQLEKAEGFDL